MPRKLPSYKDKLLRRQKKNGEKIWTKIEIFFSKPRKKWKITVISISLLANANKINESIDPRKKWWLSFKNFRQIFFSDAARKIIFAQNSKYLFFLLKL